MLCRSHVINKESTGRVEVVLKRVVGVQCGRTTPLEGHRRLHGCLEVQLQQGEESEVLAKGLGSRGSHTSGEHQHLVCCFETFAVCTFAERAVAGAAVRRRQRFLRSVWRHEQLSLKMMAASMSYHSWQTDAAPTRC